MRRLRGTLTIASEDDAPGYRLRMQLPTSLFTNDCLLVRAGEQLFAIPSDEVRQAVLLSDGEVREMAEGRGQRAEGRQGFAYDETIHALVHLHTLLGMPEETTVRGGHRSVLLTAVDGKPQAVLVDDLLDVRELVVKPLGECMPKPPGLTAATIVGDGSVAMIVDLSTLLRLDIGVLTQASVVHRPEQAARLHLPTVLIVDDSLSMRRALSQLVEDAGYRALTASDGMHALTLMLGMPPDLALVDLEMPQMNGLELTAHLRSQRDTAGL